MNPYTPPTSDDSPVRDTRICPDCGAAMVPGDITGNAYWMEKGASVLRRLVSRGDVILGGSFRITLRTQRLTGFRCGNCGMLVIPRKS